MTSYTIPNYDVVYNVIYDVIYDVVYDVIYDLIYDVAYNVVFYNRGTAQVAKPSVFCVKSFQAE